MKNKLFQFSVLLLCLILFTTVLQAQSDKVLNTKISVKINKLGHAISPTLFGFFFEDINFSTDGGIYPERVCNRSFEDANTLQNWNFLSADGKSSTSISDADVQSRPAVPPLNAFNRKSLCIKANVSFKLENVGYFGMNIVQDDSCSFKLAARAINGFDALHPTFLRFPGGRWVEGDDS
jgi:hypothetical protein